MMIHDDDDDDDGDDDDDVCHGLKNVLSSATGSDAQLDTFLHPDVHNVGNEHESRYEHRAHHRHSSPRPDVHNVGQEHESSVKPIPPSNLYYKSLPVELGGRSPVVMCQDSPSRCRFRLQSIWSRIWSMICCRG